jgi:hypothetical protein
MTSAQQIEGLKQLAAVQTEIYDRLTALTHQLIDALAANDPTLIAARAAEGEGLLTKLRSGQFSLMSKLVQYATACRADRAEAAPEPALPELRQQLRARIKELVESAHRFSAAQSAAAPLIANGLAFNGTLLDYLMPPQPGQERWGAAQYQRFSNLA